MTKTLYVVRHAKAEDRAAFLTDHDRELVPQGIMAAARMGRHLRATGVVVDRILSSTAPRARHTARVMAEQLGLNPDEVLLDEKLYDGGPKAYLAAVNNVPDTCQTVMVVGHNPDVTYFAEYLTHQDVGSMSKGSVVSITFAEETPWAGVSGRTGSLAFYVTPKELPAE